VGAQAWAGVARLGVDSVAVCGDLDTGRTLVRVITHGDPGQGRYAALTRIAMRQTYEHSRTALGQVSTAHRACEMVPVELTVRSLYPRRKENRW